MRFFTLSFFLLLGLLFPMLASAVLPSAPSNVTAIAGNGSATVSFTPGSIGSGALVKYWAACGVDTTHLTSVSGSSSPITVTGLTNGTVYYCWALTESTEGYGQWSAKSSSVTPTSVTPVLPSAPTNVTATAGDGSVSVFFTAGSIGSGALVNYWAACDKVDDTTTGNAIYAYGSSSPVTVTGLTNGTAYSCGALTRSTAGDSPWSSRASPVTPVSSSAASTQVIEFYNAGIDHYFMTAYADEAVALDNKPSWGWTRTGKTFNVWLTQASAPSGASPVCRFFGVFANGTVGSHFYTVDADECANVKSRLDWGWNYEGDAFYAVKPAGGACTGSTSPVYRVFNNGMGGAPNHRYMTSMADVDTMTGCGWVYEGISMCAPLGTSSGGAASCGNTGGGGGGTKAEVTVTPSATPQTVTVNGVSVTIPGGILSGATKLTVTTPSSKAAQLSAPNAEAKILRSFDISLGDLVSFGQELVIEFPYDSGEGGPEGDNLWIYSLDEQTNNWITEKGEVDAARKVIVVRADHLSTWIEATYPDYLSVGQNYNNFKVYYNPNHTQPRKDKSGGYAMRDLASDTLDALETARAAYVGANFKPPLQNTVGVVITDLPGGSEVEMHGCILLNRADLSSLNDLRGITAHELFHVIQNRYFMIKSMMEKQWWIEGTPDYAAATIAWRGVLSLDGLDSDYFETPLLSDSKAHAYQLAQFIRYLVTVRGADFKAMWDFVAAQEPYTVVMAFQQTIGNAFPAFQSYVENVTGKVFSQVWTDYVDYAMFGNSGLMAGVVNTSLTLSDTATWDSKTLSVGSYAAKVVNVLVAPSALTRSFELSATGLASGTTVEIWQLANGDRATAVLKSVLVQDSDSAPFSLGANDSLYAVVINTATETRSVKVIATSSPSTAFSKNITWTEFVLAAKPEWTTSFSGTVSGPSDLSITEEDASVRFDPSEGDQWTVYKISTNTTGAAITAEGTLFTTPSPLSGRQVNGSTYLDWSFSDPALEVYGEYLPSGSKFKFDLSAPYSFGRACFTYNYSRSFFDGKTLKVYPAERISRGCIYIH